MAPPLAALIDVQPRKPGAAGQIPRRL